MYFPQNLHKNPQVNPQEKPKVLVMAELATKEVGAEPGLVPRLAGGWLRPWFYLIVNLKSNIHETSINSKENIAEEAL